MRKQIASIVIVGGTMVGALVFVPEAKAQSPVVLDPINLTQNIMLVQQKIQELQSMAQQIKMFGEQIKKWSFSDIFNTLTRMGDLKDQINSNQKKLEDTLGKLPEEWTNVNLDDLKKFRDERLDAARDRTKEMLKTQELIADNAEKIKGQVESYVSKSNAASGALSAIQAGNEMLATTISQIQDMQALEIANLQSDIENTAVKQSKEAWDQAYSKIAAESKKYLSDE